MNEGDKAPDFTLSDQNGQTISLNELKGAPIVLYFYPKDDTPGCTTQACAFRDARSDYEALGARVIGVSPDSMKSHLKFAEKFSLPFTLLADEGHQVSEAYGLWKEKSLYGKKYMGVERTTFLIDGEGVIRKIFPKVKIEGHSEEVLAAVREIAQVSS